MNGRVEPNQGPFPSDPGNNPMIGPMVGMPFDFFSMGEVPEETAIGAPDTDTMYTPQGPRSLLMAFRQAFPFVPVLPVPTYVKTLHLAANAAENITFEDQIIGGMVLGVGDYYMSLRGNAEIPTNTTEKICDSMYKPDRIMFYMGGIKSLSFISATAGTIVTFIGWHFNQLPR